MITKECQQCGKNDDGGLYRGLDNKWRCCSCIMAGQEEAIKENPEYYSQSHGDKNNG